MTDGDILNLVRSGAVWMSLNMGDTFAYGCADSEDVPASKLGEVALMWQRYQHDGLVAWVSAQRDWCEPIEALRTEKYALAVAEMKRAD